MQDPAATFIGLTPGMSALAYAADVKPLHEKGIPPVSAIHSRLHAVIRMAAVGALLSLAAQTVVADDVAAAGYQPGPVLEKALAGPMADHGEIIFAERVSGRDHWYVTFGYYSCPQGPGSKLGYGQYPDGKVLRGYEEGGRLCRLNLGTGERRVILDDPQGGVRDPQLHYDGTKILFAYRRGGTPTYHL